MMPSIYICDKELIVLVKVKVRQILKEIGTEIKSILYTQPHFSQDYTIH